MKKVLAYLLVLATLGGLMVLTEASADDYWVVDGYVIETEGKAYIEASLDGGKTWSPAGVYLNDWQGERITFTCRNFMYPEFDQNEVIGEYKWGRVEEKEIMVRTVVPSYAMERDFAYSIDDVLGVISTRVNPYQRTYEFTMINGEVVIWLAKQTANANSDLLGRILRQSENGNFDVKHELYVKHVTPDIYALLPQYFIDERGIQEIEYPTPVK